MENYNFTLDDIKKQTRVAMASIKQAIIENPATDVGAFHQGWWEYYSEIIKEDAAIKKATE